FNLKTLFSPIAWSSPIHFSWFAQTVQRYPLTLQSLLLGLLTEPQAKGAADLLSASQISVMRPKKTSPFLSTYLADFLRNEVMEPDLLREQTLPDSEMMPLLHLERKQLFHLCDLLGIYDLATDLRQVVDKELLTKINAVLTPQQK